MQPFSRKLALGAIAAATLVVTGTAQADTGKLSLTGGITSIDGAAGGGITPWATIGTMGNELGVSAAYTTLRVQDYDFQSYGVAVGINDRFEISLGKQELTLKSVDALGAPGGNGANGQKSNLDIIGLKYRVAGEAILDSDNLMPQISVGVLHKRVSASSVLDSYLTAFQAEREGNELYASATKLFLKNSLLLNATARYTNANQNGLLGFGSKVAGQNNDMRLYPEFSAAYLLSPKLAVGAEYRVKPNNLDGILGAASLKETEWKDIFIAYTPVKNLTLTLAYVDLGQIVPALAAARNASQTGTLLSAQVAF